MSGRPGPSKPPAQGSAAAPSTHRFQDRRQQRMRGAGTHQAIQKDFQFKLPPAGAAKRAKTSAATPHRRITPQPEAGSSRSDAQISPIATRRSPRKSSAAAAAAATRGSSAGAQAAEDDETLASIAPASSSTDSVSTRRARRLPISSTPAASRHVSTASQPGASRAAQKSRAHDDTLEDIDSQASSDEGDEDVRSLRSGPGDVSMPLDSPAGLEGGPDLSLPVIPSPPSSASRLDGDLVQLDADASVVSQREVGTGEVDSLAAKAAQRGELARKRRRQVSPGAEPANRGADKRAKTASAAAAAAAAGKAKAAKRRERILVEAPDEDDLSDAEGDATLLDRRGAAGASGASRGRRPGRLSLATSGATGRTMSKAQQKQFDQRLRRALSLVLPHSSVLVSSSSGDASTSVATAAGDTTQRRRKSRTLLNDIDVIWSTLDEELKATIAAQPSKSVVSALKAVRRGVRAACQGISEKTDRRSRLVLDLTRARKRKREVRRFVLETRREAYRSTVEERDRRQEVRRWQKEKEDVDKINTFLDDIRAASASWT